MDPKYINTKWEGWLSHPSPRDLLTNLRDTFGYFFVQGIVLIKIGISKLEDYVTPNAMDIYRDNVEVYLTFNPYEHVGKDSVTLYIQSMVIITVAAIFLPLAVIYFGWFKTLFFLLIMVFLHSQNGIPAIYRVLLLFSSILICSVYFLLLNPSFIPLLLFLYFLSRSDPNEDLRREVNSLRRQIEILYQKVDDMKRQIT
ncbi:hypothetical protein HZS_6348 [Henneguya salminicola]|nr:hypothetical protein HZS_6348 [Henneguya salminicola]